MEKINNYSLIKKYRCILMIITIITVIITIFYSYYYFGMNIPEKITIMVDKEGAFKSSLPVTADFNEECIGAITVDNKKLNNKNKSFKIDKQFLLKSNKVGNYTVDLKAFGLLKLKEINVKVIDNRSLIVGGIPVGIYMETDGLLVLGTQKVKGADGLYHAPAEKVLKAGDYILELNGVKVVSKADFMYKLSQIDRKKVILKIRREEEIFDVTVERIEAPLYDQKEKYKMGVWIRNDMQGIGTMTYYDYINNSYGALGHGIKDVDTEKLMSVKSGSIYHADIIDVIKGRAKKPGELVGIINYNKSSEYGSIEKNTEGGIFGSIDEKNQNRILEKIKSDKLPDVYSIGLKHELKNGNAIMRSNVDDTIKEYDIEIKQINMNSNDNKNFVIKIKDKELLKKTNGIVQGMSGSPIIQNNKIVGALTHVFVNDSSMGYGIFIENMLDIAS